MSLFSLNSSHVGSLPASTQHQARLRQSSDQQSRTSSRSTTTVNYHADRKVSATSVGSNTSRQTSVLRVVNANVPQRSTSYISLGRPTSKENTPRSISLLEVQTRESSCGSKKSPSTPSNMDSSLFVNDGTFQEIDLHNTEGSRGTQISSEHLDLQNLTPSGGEGHVDATRVSSDRESKQAAGVNETETNNHRFKKLMDNLRPRHARSKGQLTSRTERWSLDDFDQETSSSSFNSKPKIRGFHRKASSWSSSGATTPLKGTRNVPDQRHTAQHSEKGHRLRFLMRSSRKSRHSDATNRASVDGGNDANRIIDDMAYARAVQRRQILEELFDSEEGYIKDLKVLTYVRMPS